MKKIVIALTIALILTACNQEPKGKIVILEPAEIAPVPPQITYNYSMKDGYEYGYEQAISQDSIDAGQVAETLVMFKYFGVKDGAYQVFSKETSGATTVLQCNNPCDFIKVMVFFNGEHIKTERVKAVEGSIGWSVMADAINGELEQYITDKNGKKVNLWMTEKGILEGRLIENP